MTQTHVRSTQCKKSKEKKKTRNPVKLLSKSLCFRVKIENSAKLNSQPRNHQKIPHSSPEKPNLSNGYGIGNKKQRRSEQWFSPAKEKKTGDTMQILSESIRHPNSPIIPLSLSNLLLLPSSASFSGYTENQTQSLKTSSSSEFIELFYHLFHLFTSNGQNCTGYSDERSKSRSHRLTLHPSHIL